jgi:hypothetical protein
MDTKTFFKYHIRDADDLTEAEKIEALEGLEKLSSLDLLNEGGTVEDDIANYYKNRNKLRKIGLRKGVKNPGASKLKAGAKASGSASKSSSGVAAKAKSFGAKIAAKIKAAIQIAKKKGLAAKAAKAAKIAAKTI